MMQMLETSKIHALAPMYVTFLNADSLFSFLLHK